MIVYDGTGRDQVGYIKQPFLGGGFSPKLQVMERDGDEPYCTSKFSFMCAFSLMLR